MHESWGPNGVIRVLLYAAKRTVDVVLSYIIVVAVSDI